MKSFLFLLGLVAVVSAYYAPLLHEDSSTRIPGQYIIVYNDNATKELISAHAQTVGSDNILGLFHIGQGSFQGFSAKLTDTQVERMRRSPYVKYVEVDQEVYTQACTTQTGATWGIDRVEKSNANSLDDTFAYDTTAGATVDSYVIDTGILITHTQFTGRAVWGNNFAGDGQNTDCNGHGTHVAGTIGGTIHGIAKKTTLIAVKVLTCAGSGSNTGVINGINWTAEQAKKKTKAAVANMSLGGGVSSAVNAAVDAATADGVVMVVAAGNSQDDACKYSPSSAKTAISVGATTIDADTKGNQVDERSSFSNFGTCVHVLAPGTNIDSAWIGGNSATRTISGTSMASPHVAGVAALWMGIQKSIPTPATVKNFIISNAGLNLIDLSCTGLSSLCQQTPNRMLHLGC